VRYDDDNEFVVKSAEEAHEDALNWFLKHVKWREQKALKQNILTEALDDCIVWDEQFED